MTYPYVVQIEDETTDTLLTLESDSPITEEEVEEAMETLFGIDEEGEN